MLENRVKGMMLAGTQGKEKVVKAGSGRVDAFDVEMGNSSSELIDYFLKRSHRTAGIRK